MSLPKFRVQNIPYFSKQIIPIKQNIVQSTTNNSHHFFTLEKINARYPQKIIVKKHQQQKVRHSYENSMLQQRTKRNKQLSILKRSSTIQKQPILLYSQNVKNKTNQLSNIVKDIFILIQTTISSNPQLFKTIEQLSNQLQNNIQSIDNTKQFNLYNFEKLKLLSNEISLFKIPEDNNKLKELSTKVYEYKQIIDILAKTLESQQKYILKLQRQRNSILSAILDEN